MSRPLLRQDRIALACFYRRSARRDVRVLGTTAALDRAFKRAFATPLVQQMQSWDEIRELFRRTGQYDDVPPFAGRSIEIRLDLSGDR